MSDHVDESGWPIFKHNPFRKIKGHPDMTEDDKIVVQEMEKMKRVSRPESLDGIMKKTQFSRKEIQMLYRGFKEGSPNGIVTFEKFLEIFARFFPYGDVSKYAGLVFTSFDDDGNGEISFEEFAMTLSVLTRGSQNEKLDWIFKIYDVEKRGRITQENLCHVIFAMHQLISPDSAATDASISKHAQSVFKKLDCDKDGIVSCEDFINSCNNDSSISSGMDVFRTLYK